jgi:hypothetical protein
MSLPLPSKLRSEVEAREARKIKNFEKILESCYNKILLTNKQCDACCCIFTCPSVVFGLPLFNMYDCINYIITKLVEKGFEVHLAVPNNIYISWKKESNPKNSNQYLAIEYPNIQQKTSNYPQERKLFSATNTQQKTKTYRPIEDYKQSNTDFNYNQEDINLFRSKINELIL